MPGGCHMQPLCLGEIRARVIYALKEVADLLCPYHSHEVTGTDLPPGVDLPWYTLTVPCCENDIAWEIEIFPTCALRSVTRCKRVDLPNGPPDGPPLKFLQPRLVWGEFSCNQIVDMIRYPGPGDGWWWLDEEALKDNQPTDVFPPLSAGAGNHKQDMKPKGIESGPQEYAAGSDAPCSHEAPEQSRQLPSTKREDDWELLSWYNTDTEQEDDKEPDYVHSPGMPPEYAKYYYVKFREPED